MPWKRLWHTAAERGQTQATAALLHNTQIQKIRSILRDKK
jgi:hypothetical protein